MQAWKLFQGWIIFYCFYLGFVFFSYWICWFLINVLLQGTEDWRSSKADYIQAESEIVTTEGGGALVVVIIIKLNSKMGSLFKCKINFASFVCIFLKILIFKAFRWSTSSNGFKEFGWTGKNPWIWGYIQENANTYGFHASCDRNTTKANNSFISNLIKELFIWVVVYIKK